MESKKKIRKAAPSSSSSSDSESSSSSSSEETRRKQKHRNIRKQQRESSSSSENGAVRKAHKHGSHKKSAHKHSHSAKVRAKLVQSSGKKKRSLSPASRLAHKHLKVKISSSKKSKLAHLDDHERRSRTPTRRDVKKDRTPDHRIASPTTRIRVSVPNNRVGERSAGRGLKDSPSISRRHIREPAGDKERAEILARCQERQRERDRIKRIQEEEERFKHNGPRMPERTRLLASSHALPEKHRHDHSRSPSRGKIPIRERLDKEYDYRRSNSREHEDYPIMRPGQGSGREGIRAFSSDRPILRDEPERNFDYRSDDRRIANHEYGLTTRGVYDERHHRTPNWEAAERDVEPRGSRVYEGSRDWEASGHSKRISDEPYKETRERTWNDLPHDKWSKEKDSKEWNRSWKETSSTVHPVSTPTISHPRRWPGPGQSDTWTPRGSHKLDHPSSSGPPFKPRFGGPGSSPHFGFKRFPFKRFPNLYSKINYSSRRVIPSSAASTTSSVSGSIIRPPLKSSENSVDSLTPNKIEANDSGELINEPEEDKVEQPDTTFSGNVDMQSQEEEGNLSEFSDIDDEILNREEELARGVAAELNASAEDQTGDHNDLKIISKIHANKELKKEMDLDFEEISDGELEEESRIKGLGDALGVDWASLAKETQLPIKHEPDEFVSSTKSRWTPHRILWDIGVSTKIAGEDFARRVLTEAREELRREKQELLLKMEQTNSEKTELTNGDVKQELAVVSDGTNEVKIKTEPKDEEEEGVKHEPEDEMPKIELPEDDFDIDGDVLTHPLAQVQVLLRKLQTKRKNLILHSTGKYGRALSARRDLKIRRQLCNLPTRDIKIDRNCVISSELHKNVDAIYRKLIGEVS